VAGTDEGQGGHAPRNPRPKFAVSKVCRIQILDRAKMLNIMCKCAESFRFWRTLSPDPILELGYWATLGDFRWPGFPSYINWQWVPLLQSAARQTPRNRKHGCHGWM